MLSESALAWSFHRARVLRRELGYQESCLTFLWMDDCVYVFSPDVPMVNVDGADYGYYTQMDIDWDRCEKAELDQALRMARVNMTSHQHSGLVPDELLAPQPNSIPPAVLAPS